MPKPMNNVRTNVGGSITNGYYLSEEWLCTCFDLGGVTPNLICLCDQKIKYHIYIQLCLGTYVCVWV